MQTEERAVTIVPWVCATSPGCERSSPSSRMPTCSQPQFEFAQLIALAWRGRHQSLHAASLDVLVGQVLFTGASAQAG